MRFIRLLMQSFLFDVQVKRVANSVCLGIREYESFSVNSYQAVGLLW